MMTRFAPHPSSRLDLGEEGMTLIELLIAIVITGLILAPIAASLFLGLRATDGTILRLNESHDRQLLSTYFPRDILSADSAPDTNAGCSPPLHSNKLRVEWDEKIGATTDTYVSAYQIVPEGTEWVLNRHLCINGTLTETVTVAHQLKDSNSATFTSAGETVTLTLTDTSDREYSLTGSRRIGRDSK